MTKDDAEKMDIILAYLVKNETARVKYKQIIDLLDVSLEKAKYLHQSILKYHSKKEPIVSIQNASNIAKKPNITEEFLNKGGFKLVYLQQSEMEKHANN